MQANFKWRKAHRLVLLVVYLYVLILGIIIISLPPVVDPDSAWGFLVMHRMAHGGHFNMLISPNPANISLDQSQFLAWWSPGQYLAPYLFKLLFAINTGRAVSLTVIGSSLVGLAGYYNLFKRVGFSKWISAISVAFIATQHFFMLMFSYYTGGEVLLFAFFGWFLYGCFSFDRISWRTLAFIFFISLIGFFAKSSVLWMLAAGVCCMWINISFADRKQPTGPGKASFQFDKKTIVGWIKSAALLGLPLGVAFVVIYVFYISKGPNPSVEHGVFSFIPEALLFPLAAPLLTTFSVDESLHGLIYQPDTPMVSYQQALAILGAIAAISLGFVWLVKKYVPLRNYKVALFVFYSFSTVFFAYMFLHQSAISFEGRHFRVLGLLAIPGIIYLVSKSRIASVLFAMLWTGLTIFAFNYFKGEVNQDEGLTASNSGLSQQVYDSATLKEIIRLDQTHRNDALFVVMSPDIAMEICHNRSIVIDAESIPGGDFSKIRYSGTCGQLYILLPSEYVTVNKPPSILGSFSGYHHFSGRQLSADYYLYSATN